jgi:tripartite-type tricarboxylate transporter receptor subunit TctC
MIPIPGPRPDSHRSPGECGSEKVAVLQRTLQVATIWKLPGILWSAFQWFPRRIFLGALACVGLSCMSATLAQPYPTRPITLIVPYGVGGPLDTLTRIVSERMRVSLAQPIVIDNVTGASGVIGVGRAVRADPDGYTVSVGNWPTHVVNGATFTLQYDLLRDLEPVALLSSNPYVVVSRNGLPAKNLLIDVLRANPEMLTLGTAGPGSGQHIGGLYFQSVTGTTLRFVPYRAGSSDIMKDLVGAHIDLTFEQVISALPYLRNGQVKAYAVTAKARLPPHPIFRPSMRLVHPACTSRHGPACGCLKVRQRTLPERSQMRPWTHSRIRTSATGLRIWAK